ncbi:MAG TPA: hypothetical protein VFR87_00690 [Nocardioidaceae bacterium]|nr:hypothetical protein [Nocardioidaceae bacterium]
MSDPLDDLRNLEAARPGRLAPTEVRRRGDRMRTRRTVLRVVTAAAAVAVIASGGAVVAGSLTSTGPQPAPAPAPPSPAHPSPTTSPPAEEPPPEGWLTGIPHGFPIGLGLPEPGGDVPEWERADGPATPLSGIACAESEDLPAGPVDGLRVEVAPPDESQWRHLLLFADAATAVEAQAALLSSADRCSEGAQSGPDDQLSPEEVRWTVGEAVSGGTHVVDIEGALHARGTDVRVPGRVLTRVVRVGNAVLVDRRDSASSATGMDTEVRAFTADVEAVTEEMCVFSPDGCSRKPGDVDAAEPDGLEPEPLPYAITVETLEEHTGQDGWMSTQGVLDEPMVCAEESTEALAGNRTDTRQYARFDDEGFTLGMATTTVLDFSSSTEAPDGFERAADWLTTCDEPLDRRHRIFSADEAYGAVHSGSWTTGPWRWRTVMSAAPEVCEECDAAWNHHQGVALGGERLVIVQVSTRGDLQRSVDEADSPMPGLLEAAAALAAGRRSGSATEPFGPVGVRGVELGMRPGEATDGKALIVGGSRCQAFLLRGPGRPADNIDGFVERGLGVAVLFARVGMTTAEGVGLGSSRDDVLAALPGGEDLVPGYRVRVPGYPDRYYQLGFEDGRVVSLVLALDEQTCVG